MTCELLNAHPLHPLTGSDVKRELAATFLWWLTYMLAALPYPARERRRVGKRRLPKIQWWIGLYDDSSQWLHSQNLRIPAPPSKAKKRQWLIWKVSRYRLLTFESTPVSEGGTWSISVFCPIKDLARFIFASPLTVQSPSENDISCTPLYWVKHTSILYWGLH